MFGQSNTGSKEDYAFTFSGSAYLNNVFSHIEPIHFGGGSGSYFNDFSGSYFSQYNMKKPIYMTSNYDDTGSRDDYAFNISSSLYTFQSFGLT